MSQSINSKQKEEVVISYNKLAMEQLQQENYENSMSYLKQALMGIKSISDESKKNKLMAITFNNLGCFFKRMSNYPEALKYLYKSIDLENKLPNELSTISGAHLNICSILSQQGDHSQAIRHGLRSVFLLKSIYKYQPKLIPTLVIAYFHVGNEYQLLGQSADAEDCFKIGHKISFEELGPQHHLTNTLKACLTGNTRRVSPNYERIGKIYERNSVSPKERVPIVSAKSRSTSQDNKAKLNSSFMFRETAKRNNDALGNRTGPFSTKNSFPRKIEIQRPFVNKIFSDEEGSQGNDRSFNSLNGLSRKIDLGKHKATEKLAAIIIQSWWRGIRARRRYKEIRLGFKLKQAENKARKAVEEYEKLKQLAAKSNKKKK